MLPFSRPSRGTTLAVITNAICAFRAVPYQQNQCVFTHRGLGKDLQSSHPRAASLMRACPSPVEKDRIILK